MEQAVYIWVDLSAKSAKPYPIPKVYCEKYIGGKCRKCQDWRNCRKEWCRKCGGNRNR